MKLARALGFLFLVVLWGCSDTSRSSYNFPIKTTKTPEQQLDLALKHLSEEIKEQPDNPINYYKKAQWYFEAGRYDEALSDLSKGERISPNSGEILFLKSRILQKKGQDNALETALLAEDQSYESADLYTLITNLYLDKKDFKNAQRYIQKAAQLYPYNADLYECRGRYYALNRDTTTAIANYKQALNLRPAVFEHYDNLIKIYSNAHQIDSALVINTLAQKKFPKKNELIYNNALILQKAGYSDSSLVVFRRFLKLEPTRLDVYGRMGDIYFENKNYSSAFISYNKWATTDPKNINAKLKAARTYIVRGNLPAAKYYLSKALEELPDNPKLKNELAAVNYSIEKAENLHNWMLSKKREEKNTESVVEDRIFDNSLEIHKIPKRKGIIIDSTRN